MGAREKHEALLGEIAGVIASQSSIVESAIVIAQDKRRGRRELVVRLNGDLSSIVNEVFINVRAHSSGVGKIRLHLAYESGGALHLVDQLLLKEKLILLNGSADSKAVVDSFESQAQGIAQFWVRS